MKNGKRGCLASIFLKVVLPLLILAAILIVVAVILAIGPETSYPAPKIDGRDAGTMAGIVTRLARSLVDKEGRVVETAELRLTQNEVQTLLDAMMRDESENAPETVPYAAAWEDGRLQVFFCGSLQSGKAVNVFVELAPYVTDGQLRLVPGAGSVGKLPLPRFALEKGARLLAQEAMKREKIRTSLSPFSRIEPGPNGSLVMMFDPRDVNAVVRVLRSAGGEEAGDEDDEDEEDEDFEDDGSEDEEDPDPAVGGPE